MTAPDMFAVQLVLDGQPMNLTGIDLETAAHALSQRGHSRSVIAQRCRVSERQARLIVDAVKARARRAT